MSKKKKPFETRASKKIDSADRDKRLGRDKPPKRTGFFADRGVRETIESIVVAVMLALMFRAFEAEAFVIPTGSMAPTLQGRHLDTTCDKCGYQYRTGASRENPGSKEPGIVFESVCPICRHEKSHARKTDGSVNTNEDSFNGDRILVSKFAYDFADPKRWDVIVFKYPGNAKQNYIKRLIGLPNETLKIVNGDIYVKRDGNDWQIARKPSHKLKVMLQIVDDTDFIADELVKANWPSRWNQWSAADAKQRSWKVSDSHAEFSIEASDQDAWLSYRHLVPRTDEWKAIDLGKENDRIKTSPGELITDHYAYNDAVAAQTKGATRRYENTLGYNWVGDLAVEANIDVKSDSGSVGLKLVEGGVQFECWIDVATGQATVTSNDKSIQFGEAKSETVTAKTKINGAGNYDVRFANVDNQLTLWINDRVVEFDTELTYDRAEFSPPTYSKQYPGDAEPVAIGARGLSANVTRLKVLRDIYYIPDPNSFDSLLEIRAVIEDPLLWNEEPAMELLTQNAIRIRRGQTETITYTMDDGQYMPMGDNSPQSQDGRMWSQHPINGVHYVERDMLTGKALFVYWPHPWRPCWPNFRRMGFIR